MLLDLNVLARQRSTWPLLIELSKYGPYILQRTPFCMAIYILQPDKCNLSAYNYTNVKTGTVEQADCPMV